MTWGQPCSYWARTVLGSARRSHPACSRRTSVWPPAAAKVTSTWVDCSTGRPGCQVKAIAAPGSQRVTVPQMSCLPSGARSMSRPSRDVTVEPSPKTLWSATGHQDPMRSVKISKAVAGSASTTTSRWIGGTVVLMWSPDRLVPVVVLGGMTDFGGERAEHGVPCLDEPQLCCREPVGSERVQVPASGAAAFDEPGCREDSQVL